MQDRPQKIFFSGIGGSGVSAIACFVADKGHAVVGSDRAFDLNPDHPLAKAFRARGITLVPQDGNGLDSTFDFAVFSTAVESDRPEAVKARELGVPIKTRPEYLAEIASEYHTIAVSGTSGKSTAAGMLAFLMSRLGFNPNFIGGGRVKQFKTASNPGNAVSGDSEYLIIEACESDGSIVSYRPRHAILLNLALDHHPVDETAIMFKTLMKHTQEKVFMNRDDENLLKLTGRNTISYSVDTVSDYRAEKIVYKPFGSDFSVRQTDFSLSLPGKYNLYNALSCISLLSEFRIPLDEINDVLPHFQGIDRRFDVHLNNGKHLVIDDYAHNPHKISSLMETVKTLKARVCYIFQPHGFGPTRMMKREYIQAFTRNLRNSDHLMLLPIYYVGGTAGRDISSHDLADGIKAQGKSAEVIEERREIFKNLHDCEAYVIFGARDETLSDFAGEIAGMISQESKRH